MFGKKHSREALEKMSGCNNPMFGKIHSNKTKEKMSVSSSGSKNPNYLEPHLRTETIGRQIRDSNKYKKWRRIVRKLGRYSCLFCGSKEKIHADHIKPFAIIILENNIKTLEEAWECNELWDLKNSRILCENCHKKTDTWA